MIEIEKKSHNAENTERGDLLGFFNIHFVGKYQKIEGGPFGEIFFRKSLRAENTLSEYPLAPLSFLDDVKVLHKSFWKSKSTSQSRIHDS